MEIIYTGPTGSAAALTEALQTALTEALTEALDAALEAEGLQIRYEASAVPVAKRGMATDLHEVAIQVIGTGVTAIAASVVKAAVDKFMKRFTGGNVETREQPSGASGKA